MAFTEKPPMLRGTEQEQIRALRDYLFRMAQSLSEVAAPETPVSVTATVRPDGTRVFKPGRDEGDAIAAVRKNAQELRDLIIKTARELGEDIEDGDNYVIAYADSKAEAFESEYVAKSYLGTYTERIMAEFEASARGVVESYNYSEAIRSMQDSIGLLQDYNTELSGQIRRGIVEVPGSNPPEYELGIAISQNLQFTGQTVEAEDGNVYYYLNSGQTFGLYTSKGWQFWINGYKVGWFESTGSVLHVAIVQVEQELRMGDSWQIRATPNGSEFEIMYVGS